MATRVFVSAIVEDNDKFLVLKRSPTAHFAANQWEFINGSIKENETAEDALRRELKEETGLLLIEEEKLPTYETEDSDGTWVVIPFRAKVSGQVVISQEHTEFKWAKPSELININELADDWNKIGGHFDA